MAILMMNDSCEGNVGTVGRVHRLSNCNTIQNRTKEQSLSLLFARELSVWVTFAPSKQTAPVRRPLEPLFAVPLAQARPPVEVQTGKGRRGGIAQITY
jgi:hypothetical protein